MGVPGAPRAPCCLLSDGDADKPVLPWQDLAVRRVRAAAPDTMKEALRQPKVDKKKASAGWGRPQRRWTWPGCTRAWWKG